ncbi:hypothetical protein Syun_009925 [Stephania yunnanensis]|uniref:Uncharacterized protein n=1 Tax=Stephania yunnanensis TaxID=152371 RepID=A0AAP0PSR7_9MAGN
MENGTMRSGSRWYEDEDEAGEKTEEDTRGRRAERHGTLCTAKSPIEAGTPSALGDTGKGWTTFLNGLVSGTRLHPFGSIFLTACIGVSQREVRHGGRRAFGLRNEKDKGWEGASGFSFTEPTFQQSHQHERRTIADIERNMISDWLSQSTTQQPLQEDIQYMKSKLQNSETQVTAILEHLMDEEELPLQPVFDSDETVNADTSKSVEFDEFSIVDEHLSEPEETLDISSPEPDITIAQYDDDEARKKLESFRKGREERK